MVHARPDYPRIAGILGKAGFQGWVSLEMEGKEDAVHGRAEELRGPALGVRRREAGLKREATSGAEAGDGAVSRRGFLTAAGGAAAVVAVSGGPAGPAAAAAAPTREEKLKRLASNCWSVRLLFKQREYPDLADLDEVKRREGIQVAKHWLDTNMYDCINNKPPTCSAASDAARIESVDSSGDNSTDELRVSLGSYSTAGLTGSSKISAIIRWVVCGEEIAPQAKAISFGVYSNPAGSLNSVPDVAPTSGAVGTYPTQWFWNAGVAIEEPAVTLATDVLMNMRKTDTGTRSATVGFLGAYVAFKNIYAPGIRAPAELMMPLLAM